MSSDVDWTSAVQALIAAMGQHTGPDYCGESIRAAIVTAGWAYDTGFSLPAPPAGSGAPTAVWNAAWLALLTEANRIIILTGRASVPFSSPPALGPIAGALATAIAIMQVSEDSGVGQYGVDAISDAQQLATALAAQFALAPPSVSPGTPSPPSPQKVALLALLERATQYTAFLSGP